MSYIVNERYDRLKRRLSPRVWSRIKAKAQWEGISLSAVMKDWPSLLPKRVQALAASCFVDTRYDLLTARREELRRELRRVERALSQDAQW